MLIPEYTNRFKKDLKAIQKRNWDIHLLKEVLMLLCAEIPLQEKYKDHALRGNWAGHRVCHIQPDWLLIYQVGNGLLVLERTGSHSDLF
ncbi:type II toxin-antitoxin system RelE/ParE family toxin [Desulfoscipio gibsoniae]|uniref:Addiction module toxin component, YafQ family/addiction module toxin, RelE/StbE family n=1 Tax=Desulfoscipio gibsoniae DSM 7213 TaxID=767817 RepID=R4KC10_9FIRM|nr:type II toxin-antitoxin system mRNA interferase toxin, RelE/StbE family [Desulfoscipio gibsoniae]AGL00733.1 addiction module toxin component, YafQ family/addiction module toxin, RelE/StbE family [Desulfoscipio gibsoniae DSM 7213]